MEISKAILGERVRFSAEPFTRLPFTLRHQNLFLNPSERQRFAVHDAPPTECLSICDA